MGSLLDGKAIAAAYGDQLKERIETWVKKTDVRPGLAVVLCGEDPSSKVYVNNIMKKCTELGLVVTKYLVDPACGTEALHQQVITLNADTAVHGIIVQFPLPKIIDEKRIREAIAPEKDVDSAGAANMGRLYAGLGGFVPCTPKGMMVLLKSLGVKLSGLHGVVVGRSNVVGKPVAQLMLNENMTVTICHSRTQDMASITRQADVLMTGVGVAELIGLDHIKAGAIVIDAGINVTEKGLVGDVDWQACQEKACAITPVPGGVGPTTNLMLAENTLEACMLQYELKSDLFV